MKSFCKNLTMIAAVCFLASCANNLKNKEEAVVIDHLSAPTFDIKSFFSGNLEGFGVIYDSSGKMIATEKLDIKGKWRENKGLIERNYSNGALKEDSTWLVDLKDDGSFSVIGHGFSGSFEGKQVGNAARIKYSSNATNKDGAKVENQTIENYYMADENSVISIVENFSGGKLVNKETLSFKKLASSPSASSSNPTLPIAATPSKAKE